jgi:hypothetical protein
MLALNAIEAAIAAMKNNDPQPTARLMRELSESLLREDVTATTSGGIARIDAPGEYAVMIGPMPNGGPCDFLAEIVTASGRIAGGFTMCSQSLAELVKKRLHL